MILIKLLVVVFLLVLLMDRVAQLTPVFALGEPFDIRKLFALSLKMPHFWTSILAPVFYLAALWETANFIRVLEVTENTESRFFVYLERIGQRLMYAAMATICIAPSIEAWMLLGKLGITLDWDVSAVAIGTIGSLFGLIAKRYFSRDQAV
jgi:hypothetical protein